MIANGRKKVEDLKLKREITAKEAEDYESDCRKKIAEAEAAEAKIKELTKEMLRLETQRDKAKTKEMELSEKVEAVEKMLRSNEQTYNLLKEKRERTDGSEKKLSDELSQLKKENREWQKKQKDMATETRKCEDILKKRIEKAKFMQLKSKKLELSMTTVQNSARCVEMESTASTRRNSVKEERIYNFSASLPSLKTTFEEGEKRAVELERKSVEQEEELKQLKECYIVLKNEFENIIADIGH